MEYSENIIAQTKNFDQFYVKFMQYLPAKQQEIRDLQVTYWQELFFIWKQFMSHRQENFFMKDFTALHIRHLEEMLEYATN